METIKEFISQYLPALTSISGTIIAIVTFFTNVKKILSEKISENNALKTQISNLQALFSEVTTKCTSTQENIAEELKTALEKNSELSTQNELLKEQTEKLEEVIREDASLKNQLTELLRKEGE